MYTKDYQKYNELFDMLLEMSSNYYNIDNDESEDSDEQYDQLENEFFELGDKLKTFPQLAKEVTEKYNYIKEGKHKIINNQETSVMVSIEKIPSKNHKNHLDIVQAFETCRNRLLKIPNIDKNHKDTIILSPKFDGIAIKVIMNEFKGTRYVEKILTKGGQDVTEILKFHKCFRPDVLPHNNIIHGELVVSKNTFNIFYKNIYSNPRNAVVGILKTNPEHLTFIPCTNGINSYYSSLFNPYAIKNPTREFIFDLWNKYYTYYKTDSFPFQIDGIVVSSVVEQQYIPENSQYPNNIIAIKFPSESKETEVLDIKWTIKKSGKLTPVLSVKITHIDGSNISEVSAYSFNKLKELKCGIGSKILITKGNDIIPKVVKTLQPSTNFNLPENYVVNGKHIYNNNNNNNNEIESFRFVNAFKALNIQNIGEKTATDLGYEIFGNDIIKIFNKEFKSDVIDYLGIDSANWRNFKVVYDIKTISLDTLIYMLQFQDCGVVLSKRCAEIITKINTDTKGLNKSVVQNVCSGDGFRRIQESIQILKSYGVNVTKPITISDDVITFEMTGNPPKELCKSKAEFVELMRKKYPNSQHLGLTKTTNILFTDDLSGNSSKMNKARKYNVQIKLYKDF